MQQDPSVCATSAAQHHETQLQLLALHMGSIITEKLKLAKKKLYLLLHFYSTSSRVQVSGNTLDQARFKSLTICHQENSLPSVPDMQGRALFPKRFKADTTKQEVSLDDMKKNRSHLLYKIAWLWTHSVM